MAGMRAEEPALEVDNAEVPMQDNLAYNLNPDAIESTSLTPGQ